MSPHDNEPVPEIPQLVPERDELVSYHRQKQHKPKAKERSGEPGGERAGSGGKVWAFLVGFIALAAAGWAGYLQMQLLAAEQRVTSLEQRLSTTDASVNQSSVALQVKIKDIDTSLTQVRDETLKRYKATLDQHGGQIDSLDRLLKNTQASLTKLDQRVAEQDKALATARAQLDAQSPLVDFSKKKVDAQQVLIDALTSKLKAIGDNQNKLDSRLSNNEEWVDSINTFRKQMNREIVNIKQQIAGGKPAAPPADLVQ